MSPTAPRVLTVVGNRPQFVKAAAVSARLREVAAEVLVHTGQHYDAELSEVFFDELGVPAPDHDLGVGSGSHAEQTAATMAGLEPILDRERPDAVLAYGDTNATLAAALVASKAQIPLVHVEAGMRSFDLAMPEEINRRATDRLSGLLLCSTDAAVANLEAEGMADRARLVGDVMADVALRFGPLAERRSDILERLGVRRGSYLVATLHRAGNVDDPASLGSAVDALEAAAGLQGPLVFPVHPRTRAALSDSGLVERLERSDSIVLTEPLGYLDFTALVRGAKAVLTDSGGLQKEAYLAGVPCVTLREATEWVETVELGWNVLAGLDPEAVLRGLEELGGRREEGPPDPAIYGGGEAGARCAREIVEWVGATAAP